MEVFENSVPEESYLHADGFLPGFDFDIKMGAYTVGCTCKSVQILLQVSFDAIYSQFNSDQYNTDTHDSYYLQKIYKYTDEQLITVKRKKTLAYRCT